MGEHLLVKYYHSEILENDNHVHLNILYGVFYSSILSHNTMHLPLKKIKIKKINLSIFSKDFTQKKI